MKNRLYMLLSLSLTVGITLFASSSAMVSISSAMTQDEYGAIINELISEGKATKADYVRKLHSLGYGTDADLEEALRRLGDSSSSTPSSTPAATPEVKCEHNYIESVTKAASCNEEGEKVFTCEKCGDIYTENIPLDESGHTYTEEITYEPTCDEAGLKTYTCSKCGDKKTEPIPKLEHDYISATTKDATCTENGEITYVCTHCNDTYTEETPTLGHDDGEWVIITESSLFNDGLREKHCIRCGELLESEVIPAQYPMWYLYVAVGIVAGLIILISVIEMIIHKRKKVYC